MYEKNNNNQTPFSPLCCAICEFIQNLDSRLIFGLFSSIQIRTKKKEFIFFADSLHVFQIFMTFFASIFFLCRVARNIPFKPNDIHPNATISNSNKRCRSIRDLRHDPSLSPEKWQSVQSSALCARNSRGIEIILQSAYSIQHTSMNHDILRAIQFVLNHGYKRTAPIRSWFKIELRTK